MDRSPQLTRRRRRSEGVGVDAPDVDYHSPSAVFFSPPVAQRLFRDLGRGVVPGNKLRPPHLFYEGVRSWWGR